MGKLLCELMSVVCILFGGYFSIIEHNDLRATVMLCYAILLTLRSQEPR